MATLNKTVKGIFSNSDMSYNQTIGVVIQTLGKDGTLEMYTYDGIRLIVPLKEIKADLIKALGE